MNACSSNEGANPADLLFERLMIVNLKLTKMNKSAPRTSNRQQPHAQMRIQCEKCVELDSKIEHYRWLASMIGDQLTVDRIKALIAQLESRKAALHPAQE